MFDNAFSLAIYEVFHNFADTQHNEGSSSNALRLHPFVIVTL